MGKGKTTRRVEAMKRLSEVKAITRSVVRRDHKGKHVSVTLLDGRRVEWWPSTGKWAAGGPGTAATHTGDVDVFLSWIERRDEVTA